MVIRRNASSPRLQSDAHVSENGAPKPRISPAGQKVRTTPLSQKLFRQTNTQRNYSKIAPRSVAGSSHSTHRVPHSNNASLSKSSGMAPTATQSGPPVNVCLTEPLYGDMKVSESLPSRSTLEKIADLPVFNVDGKTKPFKSLYWADAKESKRVFIIFIRHFFCGNCQEYLRTLGAAIPPSSLPPDTSIQIVGCGSHTLIPSYVEQTQCAYPIYADPSRKLYDVLGMARTLSLGHKGPDYIQHTLVSGMVKSIAQGLKRIGSGDVLQAGDMKQVGGEFLLEITGGDTPLANSKPGNESLKKVEVTWCHRMKNTRDHAELPEIKKVLGLEKVEGGERKRGSEHSWRSSGLARTLSHKTQRLSLSKTRKQSRSAGRDESHEPHKIDMIRQATA